MNTEMLAGRCRDGVCKRTKPFPCAQAAVPERSRLEYQQAECSPSVPVTHSRTPAKTRQPWCPLLMKNLNQ